MSKLDIVVVDYGMGNVLSVCRALEHCGGRAILTSDPKQLTDADRVVLPGVGSFGDCMAALEQHGLVEPIRQFVATGRPFLGVCVGMQILHDWGDEFDGAAGFGLIPGRVSQIPTARPEGGTRKIPHIGWTPVQAPYSVRERWRGTIFDGTSPDTAFYFVHSFSAAATVQGDVLAVADYQGFLVTAAVQRDNITGTQFHPEKSGPAGLALLGAFLQQ